MIIKKEKDANGIDTNVLYGITGEQFGTINTVLSNMNAIAHLIHLAMERKDWSILENLDNDLVKSINNIMDVESSVIEYDYGHCPLIGE